MKLRRVAISVAATTALVLGAAAAPALAAHEDPRLVENDPPTYPGGNITCEQLHVKFPDLDEHSTLGAKVDPPVNVDNEYFEATVSGDLKSLDVVAKDGFVITAVIVKGSDASHVYLSSPFEHMTAPEAGASGKPAAISNYTVCGHEDEDDEKEKKKKKKKKRDRDRDKDKDKDKTPPPPDDEDENGDDDKNGKDEEDEKKPVSVPTAVPAGHGDTGSGVAGTVGLIAALAALTAAAAAGAMLIRRRFGHES